MRQRPEHVGNKCQWIELHNGLQICRRLMFGVARRTRILPIGVRITDLAIRAMDHQFAFIPLGDPTTCVFSGTLGTMIRNRILLASLTDSPAVAAGDHMHIALAHNYVLPGNREKILDAGVGRARPEHQVDQFRQRGDRGLMHHPTVPTPRLLVGSARSRPCRSQPLYRSAARSAATYHPRRCSTHKHLAR